MRDSLPENTGRGGGDRAQPRHPYLILAIAIVLPGAGHVLNGDPTRGLVMLFYIILLGIVTAQFASADQSLLGRFAGGWFIYAISVIDAYRTARYRWEYHHRHDRETASNGG